MRMGRLHSTGGFWILVGALLLAAPLSLMGWVLLACAIHELGHYLAIRALGGEVEVLRLTSLGAVMVPRGMFGYREECLIALAGPAASLALALLSAPVEETLAGVFSLALSGVGVWVMLQGGNFTLLLFGLVFLWKGSLL